MGVGRGIRDAVKRWVKSTIAISAAAEGEMEFVVLSFALGWSFRKRRGMLCARYPFAYV